MEGAQTMDASYDGIPGDVHCLGTDCKVEDGKLTGSWYFSPTEEEAYYRKVGTATDYTPETMYARFGHWISETDNDDDAVINTYATGPTTSPSWTVNTDLTDKTATYTGDAVGISLAKTFKTDGTVDQINSGAFTADVTLTATFHASTPLLSGEITNFEGNAVGSTWEKITLEEAAVSGGNVTDGVSSATGRDGVWTAISYGPDGNTRPTGIYGGFNAHFFGRPCRGGVCHAERLSS